ncbi:LCP family protein [Phytoactinopolyspora halotolerans]|uniref:LCP family protein n=1 Tax=Phytoactinopolyspora halotolerans TaxID=1981512 RepID=A0A6L9S3Q0_9ACTN|nr:LCP family protein [Phytoactinopolyspora halotolerans]NED99283.1 LCP family protein [Phytoactinopolyspora halotolerans]
MSRARGPRGARTARLATRRKQKQQRYGRFLGFAALGSLLPGAGLIAAGRRRIGTFLLVVLAMAAALALAVVILVPQGRLLSYGGDRQMLLLIGAGLVAASAIWTVVAITSHRLLEPEGLPAGKRLTGAVVVIAATSLVVAPLAFTANTALTQRDLIGAISSSGHSHTTPHIANKRDPWADKPRLNVLLLGSDAGDGRDGVRPDTQIVASIDTKTGDTTTISIPRNLQGFPFPDESPLSDIYPDGWLQPAGADPGEWMINAVYRNVPATHPDIFEGVGNPGADATKWAVEGALGIDIDYFLMVNLEGFAYIVDALGGITLDVPRDIPIGNKELPGGGCTTPRGYIEEGEDQELNGHEALWFARSRCGADDYDRMARQQCVIDAIVTEANPRKLLTQYQSLASATTETVETDVPDDLFPALIELLMTVKDGTMESLTLDRDFFGEMGATSANPDYAQVHERIAEILEPSSGGGSDEEPDEQDTSRADESDEADASTDPTDSNHASGASDTDTDDAADAEIVTVTEEAPSDGTDDGGEEDEPAGDEPVETETTC